VLNIFFFLTACTQIPYSHTANHTAFNLNFIKHLSEPLYTFIYVTHKFKINHNCCELFTLQKNIVGLTLKNEATWLP